MTRLRALAAAALAMALLQLLLVARVGSLRRARDRDLAHGTAISRALGLTDLAVWTEARYTRHPALADRATAFQDHPGAIEHFPAGSLVVPPPHLLSASSAAAAP